MAKESVHPLPYKSSQLKLDFFITNIWVRDVHDQSLCLFIYPQKYLRWIFLNLYALFLSVWRIKPFLVYFEWFCGAIDELSKVHMPHLVSHLLWGHTICLLIIKNNRRNFHLKWEELDLVNHCASVNMSPPTSSDNSPTISSPLFTFNSFLPVP